MAEQQLLAIPARYPFVSIERYVLMPNHIHLLLRFHGEGAGASPRPTFVDVVCAWKSLVTREVKERVWQTSFYEEVIRNPEHYEHIWNYIDENPARWAEDPYHCPE